MIFFIGFLYISVVQWYRQRQRQQMYLNAVRQTVKRTSVLVQRLTQAQDGSVGALLGSPLLNCSSPYKAFRMLNDESIVLSSVEPKQTVQLRSWTSYLDLHPNEDHSSHTVMVLLEADRPPDMESFLNHDMMVPPALKVHVLQHGCPIAWKPGSPFGIVLHCSVEDFVIMCDAFGQDRLTMGEDLEVHRIITIRTVGKPQSLIQDGDGTDANTNSLLSESASRPMIENTEKVSESVSKHALENAAEENSSSCDRSEIRISIPEKAKALKTCKNHAPSPESCESSRINSNVNGRHGATKPKQSMSQFSSQLNKMKPPNILVYTGKKDSLRKFQVVKGNIEQCVNTDSYAVYHLKHDQVYTTPWADNTALLIISCENLYDGTDTEFTKYFLKGGRVLSFGSSMENRILDRKEVQSDTGVTQLDIESWKGVNTLRGRYNYVECTSKMSDVVINAMARDEESGEPVMMFVRQQTDKLDAGVAVLSQLFFEKDPAEMAYDPETFVQLKKSNPVRLEILQHVLSALGLDCSQQGLPQLTSCLLLTQTQEIKSSFMKSVLSKIKNGVLKSKVMTLQFVEEEKDAPEALQSILPVVTGSIKPQPQYFLPDVYWSNLKTDVFGRALLYTDVVPTTMTLFEGLQFLVPDDVGLIAIAGRQTTGKGRGGNAWLSPVGCAMFSLHVRLPMDSCLGQRVSFLQHITSLAVVESVRTLPGYENIELRLKWPNDIYYSNSIKLGGVIVNSTTISSTIHAVIGCGFNVNNSNPTACINDVIEQYNTQHGCSLEPCSTEQLIARTVTIIEEMISCFQKDGKEKFCHQYYKRWLHSGATVELESERGAQVKIVGLDDHGFLKVQTRDGQTISVQPDGNTFDIMHNLISLKRR